MSHIDELSPVCGPRLDGRIDQRIAAIAERLESELAGDPGLSFQAAAFHAGRVVMDVWGGPYLGAESLSVPYSVTKNIIGVCMGLLVERGLLDLDARVGSYWPEFAMRGKGAVTVRQLLSHQAGLPQASPPLSWAELLDHHRGARRLADSRPLWIPGRAFGYHAYTIGNLAGELLFRITGDTIHAFYEREVRAPNGIDFFLGVPEEQRARLTATLAPLRPAGVDERSAPTALLRAVREAPGVQVDLANDEVSWRFGHPAASGAGSARGIAALLAAAVTGVGGRAPLLARETLLEIGERQVHGYDEVLGQAGRAYAIVFQKPTQAHAFGGPLAFGHDGARGALACVDPETGVAFAWTIARGQWPGGADPRAVATAATLGRIFGS